MAVSYTSVEDLRDQISRLLGWSREDVDKFSLLQLREWVRGKDTQLDERINDTLKTGSHILSDWHKGRSVT
jgi:hypothetical protein